MENGKTASGSQTTVKRRTTWVDSLLVGDVGANTIGGRLHKKRNIDFLSRGLPDVIDIFYDDTAYRSERVNQGTTEPH